MQHSSNKLLIAGPFSHKFLRTISNFVKIIRKLYAHHKYTHEFISF